MAKSGIVGARHYALAQQIRQTLAQYAKLKDIIAMLGLEQLSPPEALVVPWLYLAITGVVALVCSSMAIVAMQKLSSRPDLEMLRAR